MSTNPDANAKQVLTILLIGHTGGGKSTIIQVCGADAPISHTPYSERGGVQMYEVPVILDGQEYILRFIDSIGLGDAGGEHGEKPLTEEEVRNSLGDFLQEREIYTANLLLWVVKDNRASAELREEARSADLVSDSHAQNLVPVGRTQDYMKKEFSKERDAAVKVLQDKVKEEGGEPEDIEGLQLYSNEDLPDEECHVPPEPDKSPMVTNGNQSAELKEKLARMALSREPVNILQDMGQCPGCHAKGDLRYALNSKCHGSRYMEHVNVRQKKIHAGPLDKRHAAGCQDQEGWGGRAVSTALDLAKVGAGAGAVALGTLAPWWGGMVAVVTGGGLVHNLVADKPKRCQSSACQGEWKCCNKVVPLLGVSEAALATDGADACQGNKTRYICGSDPCDSQWDESEESPPGCTPMCRGPAGQSPPHTMFDENGNVINAEMDGPANHLLLRERKESAHIVSEPAFKQDSLAHTVIKE